MLLHFLYVPIACFSNYGTLFFCLKSVLSVDEMVSMLIAIFFMFKQCFCFVQRLIYMLASETGKTDLACSFFPTVGKILCKEFPSFAFWFFFSRCGALFPKSVCILFIIATASLGWYLATWHSEIVLAVSQKMFRCYTILKA